MKTTVAAIILAAGQGSRIGQPKLFLRTADRTFLEAVIKTLETAGVTDITVVVRPADEERARELVGAHLARVNEHPENGPLSSLRIGLDALPGCDGYLVFPVDHPEVGTGTVTALLAAFDARRGAVIKPAFRGKAGHPVIIPAQLARTIDGADVAGGLANLIAGSGLSVAAVEVDDPTVLKNINTKDDL